MALLGISFEIGVLASFRIHRPQSRLVGFEIEVLDELRDVVRRIPRGKVSTYGAVASAAGFPGCARQVVWALRNAKGLPWHRVVGAGGRILLPGEAGLEQRIRLETERVTFVGPKVQMKVHEHRFRVRREVP